MIQIIIKIKSIKKIFKTYYHSLKFISFILDRKDFTPENMDPCLGQLDSDKLREECKILDKPEFQGNLMDWTFFKYFPLVTGFSYMYRIDVNWYIIYI